MLRFLNQCSQGRGAWLLMAFTALALELTALWFQHVMLLNLACSVFMNAARYSAFWVLR